MQHCTACNKAFATVHILDLEDGSIVDQKHLCASCAENAGMVQQKVHPLKLQSADMLELIGTLKAGAESEPGKRSEHLVCPGCNMTIAEFKLRGRMGCPRCYDVFKATLIPLLERVHDASSHRGRYPQRATAVDRTREDLLSDLKERLAAAIDSEDYEAAASLRDQIREVESAAEGSP